MISFRKDFMAINVEGPAGTGTGTAELLEGKLALAVDCELSLIFMLLSLVVVVACAVRLARATCSVTRLLSTSHCPLRTTFSITL